MENSNTTRKKGKMGVGADGEGGEIYVLIQFRGGEHFPNAFNTLSVQIGACRDSFQI